MVVVHRRTQTGVGKPSERLNKLHLGQASADGFDEDRSLMPSEWTRQSFFSGMLMCLASRGSNNTARTRVLPFLLGFRETRCRYRVGS